MKPGTVTLHRVLRAPPERVYHAFLDPDAMAKWLPPHGFTGRVHQLQVLAAKGVHLELVPGQRIVNTDRFDDANLPGEMRTTVTFKPVSVGTEVSVVQEGIPGAIPLESCHLGWQESLQLLALLVEAEVPG